MAGAKDADAPPEGSPRPGVAAAGDATEDVDAAARRAAADGADAVAAPAPPDDPGPAADDPGPAGAGPPSDAPPAGVARDPRRALRLAVLLALLAGAIATLALLGPRLRPSSPPTAVARDAGPPGPLLPRDERPTVTPVRGAGSETLTGVVVDGAGAPVGGVAVTAVLEAVAGREPDAPAPPDGAAAVGPGAAAGPAVVPTGPDGDAAVPPAVVIAVTATDGRFTLEGLAPGRQLLTLEGSEIFTAEVRFVPVPTDELRLVVARRVAIVGRVTDRGQPRGGVAVAIDGDTLSGTRTVSADDDGHFAFRDLPEGTYRVWAWKGDLVARARRVPRLGRGPFAPVELGLEQGAIVVGKVVDRQTGGGVAAAVVITPLPDAEDEAVDEAPRHARTGADGVFRIEGVPDGRWSADAWAPGWLTVSTVDFAAGRGRPEIELVPAGIIEGRVVAADGRPVAGATLSAIEDVRAGAREVSAAADDDRLRRMSGQAPRPRAVPAAAAAFAGDDRFVPRGELGVLLGPIPYPPPAGAARTWQATIVDDEPPPPGAAPAAVLAGGTAPLAPLAVDPAYVPRWTSGGDGEFRLTGVPAGAFWVVAQAPGFAPARVRIQLALGQVLTGVELRLAAGVYLAGRVTNQRGEPVVGALLTVRAKDGPERLGAAESVAGADGRYRVGPLAGEVVVHARAHGHDDAQVEVDLAPRPGDDPSADRTLDLTLVVADAELEGAVEDAAGLPVIGARVIVDAGAAAGRSATSADGGRFRLTMLPDGPLALRVEHPDYPVQRFREAPGDAARLRLRPGGGLELLVMDHHTGQPVRGVTLVASGPGGVKRELDTGAGGRAQAVPLEVGTWSVAAAVPGYVRKTLTVEVPAGDRPGQITARDLRLELERGAVVAGVLRDRAGDRVSAAQVTVRRGDQEVTTRSDALGEFRLRDVPTGHVELVAEKGGARARVTLELRAGDERLSLDVTLE
ncbi:MAG: carboxypeptidase regulatory-like domain-containing protein [Myxococcales bacterium]|nr:carboxypeptidase regulatory-like domain-containing protein [Myxococcales bacterium]